MENSSGFTYTVLLILLLAPSMLAYLAPSYNRARIDMGKTSGFRQMAIGLPIFLLLLCLCITLFGFWVTGEIRFAPPMLLVLFSGASWLLFLIYLVQILQRSGEGQSVPLEIPFSAWIYLGATCAISAVVMLVLVPESDTFINFMMLGASATIIGFGPRIIRNCWLRIPDELTENEGVYYRKLGSLWAWLLFFQLGIFAFVHIGTAALMSVHRAELHLHPDAGAGLMPDLLVIVLLLNAVIFTVFAFAVWRLKRLSGISAH